MIDQLIRSYVRKYFLQLKDRELTFSRVADEILDKEDVELSHRTLRRKLSEEFDVQCVEPTNTLRDAAERYQKSWISTFTESSARPSSWVVEPYAKPQELKPYLNGNPNNVLIIGDTHEPFCRQGYLEHCRDVQEQYNCGKVIHIGDEVDNHAISYHTSDPDGDSSGSEFTKAMEKLKRWYKVFPEVTVIVGNHSALPFRQAMSSGLSKRFLKSYEDIWEAPVGWSWELNYEYNGVYYTHNASAKPINMAVNRRQSVVAGHHHTVANIEWNVSKFDRIFGMLVGCGIDDAAYAFSYARDGVKKSIVSCAVVQNGVPTIIPMSL